MDREIKEVVSFFFSFLYFVIFILIHTHIYIYIYIKPDGALHMLRMFD